jgi:acetyl-CoA decarbonylase/synthase complex subunit delta
LTKKKDTLPISLDLLEALAKFQQIEFNDIEMNFEELELRFAPGMVMGTQAAKPRPVVAKAKPTQLLEAEVGIPMEEYPGNIVEVRLGATKTEGGTRDRVLKIGGETVPAFYNFKAPTPKKACDSLRCFRLVKGAPRKGCEDALPRGCPRPG